MQIKKITKNDYKERQEVVIVYGMTGTGKSYSGIEYIENKKEKSKEEYVVLNVENRLHHLSFFFPEIPVIDINSLKDIKELSLNTHLIKGKNVFIDSITGIYDLLISSYIRKDGDTDLTFKEWGLISRRLNKVIFDIIHASGKDLIMSCREKLVKEENAAAKHQPDIKKEVCYSYVNTIIRIYYDAKGERHYKVEKDVIIPMGREIFNLIDLNNQRKLEYSKISSEMKKQKEIEIKEEK